MSGAQLFDRVVVGVDVEGFSARSARLQRLIQEELDKILTSAARSAGLDRSRWDRQATGDGEMVVLPGDVDLVDVTRRFVSELDLLLADHNEDHDPAARIRLRVAMHAGAVAVGRTLGHGGEALIGLARLLDSADVRKALAGVPEANLAQIISEPLFQRAVVPEIGGLRPGQFRKVVVSVPAKSFKANAYVYVPGGWPRQPPASAKKSLPFSIIVPSPGRAWPEPHEPLGQERSEPEPEPVVFQRVVAELLTELRDAMAARDYQRADQLTTQILLVEAGRDKEGSLRTADAERLPGELFTELDAIWAAGSRDRWGFAAQRSMLTDTGRVKFHTLETAFGWRQPNGEVPQKYFGFVGRNVTAKLPFYPTLRSPEREIGRDGMWQEEWRATAVAVHLRLRGWE